MAQLIVAAFLAAYFCSVRSLRILCLHGGGMSGDSFMQMDGMSDLQTASASHEFVYATTPLSSG